MPQATYEHRYCSDCGHAGIDDSSSVNAACGECDWHGPEPIEDKCPKCGSDGCMRAACPKCGGIYYLRDTEELIQQIAELDAVCSGRTREESLPYARRVVDLSAPLDYSPWRHGGWYVGAVRYPSGACGCVSRNYDDRKWRIACGRPHEETFPNRDAAARAEQRIALAQYTPEVIAKELADARATAAHIAARRTA